MLHSRFTLIIGGLGLLSGLAALWSGCAGLPPCEKHSDCPDGRYCRISTGECRQNCVADFDCENGEICDLQLGRCEDPSSGSSSGQGAGVTTGQGGAAGPGGGGVGGASSNSNSSSSGAGASTSGKDLLELCTGHGDCQSGVCESYLKGGVNRCTKACSINSDCPRGTRCLNNLCLGDDIGRSCDSANAATTCNWDCLLVNGAANFCTAPCSSGADCPNGYGCDDSPGQAVCIKDEGPCEAATDCAVACDPGTESSYPMLVGGCTSQCSAAADCPQRAAGLPPWSCSADGYCRRPSDIWGTLPGGHKPAEYHCSLSAPQTRVVLCNDGMHMDFTTFTIPAEPTVDCSSSVAFEGSANDSCVNSCRYGGGCAYGYACVGVGSAAAQRIGLCLPVGAKEPGTACANNTECAFGYCVNGTCSRDCTLDGLCPGGLSCVNGDPPMVEGTTFRRCE